MTYVLWSLGIGAVLAVPFAAFLKSPDPKTALIAGVVASTLTALLKISISRKRLHDLNKTGWWQLFAFVPYLSIVFLCYLVFARGTVGPNTYGPDPREDAEG